MAVKSYYRDSQGNLYYIIHATQGSIAQNNDMGLYTGVPQVGDGGAEIAGSKAVFFKFTVNYENEQSKPLTEYTVELGKGQNTGTSYSGTGEIKLIVNTGTTSADRFIIQTDSINNQTGVSIVGNEQQVFTYRFRSAQGYLARIAFADTDTNNIYGVGVFLVQRIVTQDGQIIYNFATVYGVGAGVDWRGGNMYCTTNSEYMIWDSSQFDKVEDDETPDTEPDGGFGSGENPTDHIGIPDLPNVNLNLTGSTLYALTSDQMSEFTAWLWSSSWEDSIKRLHQSPMDNIIAVQLCDFAVGGVEAQIVVGNINSEKTGMVAPRWKEINCGTIHCDEYYGTFADYDPYVKFTLYLPKIGFISLPADVVVNNNLTVVYHIEVSSGEGICYLYVENTRNGFGYIYNTYSCSCCSNIALSATDNTTQKQAFMNAAINTATSTASGVATVALGGGNPASLVSVGKQVGGSLVSGAQQVATAKNPSVTRGSLGNMSSLMSYKRPYLLIDATYLTKPSGYKANNGHAIYFTSANLSSMSGFIQTIDYHTNFICPQEVSDEIERMMDGGVFID